MFTSNLIFTGSAVSAGAVVFAGAGSGLTSTGFAGAGLGGVALAGVGAWAPSVTPDTATAHINITSLFSIGSSIPPVGR